MHRALHRAKALTKLTYGSGLTAAETQLPPPDAFEQEELDFGPLLRMQEELDFDFAALVRMQTDPELKKYEQLETLEGMTVTVNNVEDANALASALKILRPLKVLELKTSVAMEDGWFKTIGEAFAKYALPSLETLYLDGNNIKDGGVESLVSGDFPLQALGLSRNKIGDDGVKALAASKALAHLIYLDLSDNRIGNDGVRALAAGAIRSSASLEHLDLGGNLIGDDGADALAIGAPPSLKILILCDNRIGSDGVKVLAEHGELARLEMLDLRRNQIDNVGVAALASACASGALARLTHLFLNGNRIGDNGVKALASACASGALESLKQLSLGYNHIGDDGVAALSSACASGALASLENLWVDNPSAELIAVCSSRSIKLNSQSMGFWPSVK